MTAYGATPEAWAYFADTLGLTEDLLPVISDPSVEPSPGSALKAFGKVPSLVNGDGRGHGIKAWTQHRATAQDIARWSRDDRHGICVIARRLRAIDIDVEDANKAAVIRQAIHRALGYDYTATPLRYREGSGKTLLPFWYEGEMPKRVLPVDGGIVEFLGESQQFVVEGTHPSGARYEWIGKEGQSPTLDAEGLEALWETLVTVYGTGEPRIARTRHTGSAEGDSKDLDEVGAWLLENYPVNSIDGGTVYVECPFAAEHTTDDVSGTRTAYFSAGSGGYAQGHVRCLGGHCEGRTDAEFLDAFGYNLAQFADLGVVAGGEAGGGAAAGAGTGLDGLADRVPLTLVRDAKGKIEPTADNMVTMLAEPTWVGRMLAYDAFKDELVWARPGALPGEEQWQCFSDNDVVDIQIQLERRGMKPMQNKLLRACLRRAATLRTIDTAQEWLGRLKWDGESRVAGFAERAWGWAVSPYAVAVSYYVWTALAGRVMEPGCQADMMPVLVGAQGLRKTTTIKEMVPAEDFYATIDLKHRDTDTARLMRGVLVGELEELRGLNSQDVESIKAWITRRTETWIPKFVEYSTRFRRRLVLFGSTNETEILNDPTGLRRFLPGVCGEMDIDWLRRWRDQLWAEGAVLFAVDGVAWRDAQTLAADEHGAFTISDAWEAATERWLVTPPVTLAGDSVAPIDLGFVRVGEALRDGLGIPESQHDRSKEMRMGKVLVALGWKRERVSIDGKQVRAYVRSSS